MFAQHLSTMDTTGRAANKPRSTVGRPVCILPGCFGLQHQRCHPVIPSENQPLYRTKRNQVGPNWFGPTAHTHTGEPKPSKTRQQFAHQPACPLLGHCTRCAVWRPHPCFMAGSTAWPASCSLVSTLSVRHTGNFCSLLLANKRNVANSRQAGERAGAQSDGSVFVLLQYTYSRVPVA